MIQLNLEKKLRGEGRARNRETEMSELNYQSNMNRKRENKFYAKKKRWS